jgi:hypothetical protein
MTLRSSVVIAGSLAQSRYGGHAWVLLQYLLGFRRLGHDVLFVDNLTPEMGISESSAVERLHGVFDPFGLGDCFALLCDGGARLLGQSRARVLEIARSSAALINVMGFLEDEEILTAAPRRLFLDIDPGFGQMWRQLGLADILSGHDAFFSYGANVGTPECPVPTCGYEWVATRPPVVLEHWPVTAAGSGFSTVGAWRGPFAPIEFEGRKYGLRVHEFRGFASLPQLTGRPQRAALDIDPADKADVELLTSGGWTLDDPRACTASPESYRSYIQNSGAEFAVAKNMYVQARTGWFSDRSVCYLASGKPVLFQDTGISGMYPLGRGLLAYSSLHEAVEGVAAICTDYKRHARAARDIAEEQFDSDKVLRELLDKAGA